MLANNEEFLQIMKCFSYIKSGESESSNLNRIESSLSRLFEINFHLSVIQNEHSDFFGLTIYPSIEVTDNIIKDILDTSVKTSTIVETWQCNKDWYVEIDSMLLSGVDINASPAEITALLLHEIGHVVYSNTIIQKLTATIREKVSKLNYITKKLLNDDKIRKLFYLTILEVCNFKDFHYEVDTNEAVSDRFVNQYRFRDNMDELIGKIIGRYGNEWINRKEDDIDNTIKIMVNWVIVNVRELEFRKKELRNALKIELMTTSSALVKRVIQHIYASFFGSVTDKYRMILSEQYNSHAVDKVSLMEAEQYLDKYYKNIIKEASAGLFDKVGRIKKVEQLDIDILCADIDRIQTNDDKIYLLDKLYIQMDKVNTALDYIEMGKLDKVKQSKSTLLNMKKQLERLRQEILATRIVDKQYGLYIKYPAGYQG